MTNISIDGREVGIRCPPYIIAEMSGNHGGSLQRALEIIEQSKRCGADAIKFQTYTPETITIDSSAEDFVVQTALWKNKKLYDLYAEAYTPYEWHKALFEKAMEVGITPLSSPFDFSAVDLLESLDIAAYKIASCELVDVNLIRYVAETGKPIILSTGMANYAEIEEALEVIYSTGNKDVCLLHCVSGYPTPPDKLNLLSINALQNNFNHPVGLSDHSKGALASVASVTLGACIIEKHFCLSRDLNTVDSDFSLEPDELAELVTSCATVYSMLGVAVDGAVDVEADSQRFRRSLYVVADVKKGDFLNADNVRSIRPSGGLHPRYLNSLLGRKAKRDMLKGTPLNVEDINQS